MKLSMVKQRQVDGFTLLEMIITLALVSFLIILVPLMSMRSDTLLRFHMEQLKARLMIIQNDAITQKRRIEISFYGSNWTVDGESEQIGLQCVGELSFNENGNVNQAMSIPCSLQGKSMKLVVLLGSGRMYVK